MSAGSSSAAVRQPDGGLEPPERSGGAAPREARMILRAQKMAFWVLYDHAGALVLLNVLTLAAVAAPVWFLAVVLPDWPGLAVAAAAGLSVSALAGQANLMAALLAHEPFSTGVFLRGAVRQGPRVAGVLLFYMLGAGISGFGALFYAGRTMSEWPLAGWLLAGTCVSGGVMLALTLIYLLPALVLQGGSTVAAVRTSALLVARHPVLTLGIFLLAVLQSVALATPPGVLLLSTWPLVALACSGYELLARQYAGEVGADGDDVFLNRGFSDFLFPWKV